MRSVFDFGMGAPIALPQDPAPRRDQRNEAKPGERNRRDRKLLEHNYGYGRIEEIDRESDRHLPEHRAHLSSTDIPEGLVGGRAFQYRKPRISRFQGQKSNAAASAVLHSRSGDAQDAKAYPNVLPQASRKFRSLEDSGRLPRSSNIDPVQEGLTRTSQKLRWDHAKGQVAGRLFG